MIATENQEQRALVRWLSIHPVLKDYYFKNHNEGLRTIGQGWNLKLMGLRSGVYDLFICYPVKPWHGLFLEVKRNMRYSASQMSTDTWLAQDEFRRIVKSVGYKAEICYGWEDGKHIIDCYLNGC